VSLGRPYCIHSSLLHSSTKKRAKLPLFVLSIAAGTGGYTNTCTSKSSSSSSGEGRAGAQFAEGCEIVDACKGKHWNLARRSLSMRRFSSLAVRLCTRQASHHCAVKSIKTLLTFTILRYSSLVILHFFSLPSSSSSSSLVVVHALLHPYVAQYVSPYPVGNAICSIDMREG
jgi:hypothetical protein